MRLQMTDKALNVRGHTSRIRCDSSALSRILDCSRSLVIASRPTKYNSRWITLRIADRMPCVSPIFSNHALPPEALCDLRLAETSGIHSAPYQWPETGHSLEGIYDLLHGPTETMPVTCLPHRAKICHNFPVT